MKQLIIGKGSSDAPGVKQPHVIHAVTAANNVGMEEVIWNVSVEYVHGPV